MEVTKQRFIKFTVSRETQLYLSLKAKQQYKKANPSVKLKGFAFYFSLHNIL